MLLIGAICAKGNLMQTKHFDFIDALRGYAILGVMVVHVASALNPTTSSLSD